MASTGAQTRDFQSAASRALDYLRSCRRLDTWVVGRRQGSSWQVLISSDPAVVGMALCWEDTICARVDAGQAGWATLDVDRDPVVAPVRDALGFTVRTFVTVPLPGPDGELLGTLCGWAEEPSGEEVLGWYDELCLLGEVLGTLLSTELHLEREARFREAAELDAHTDSLTGLGNRRRWDQQVLAEEARCRRHAGAAAVITVDVDGLKQVNDRWGHDAGDALLRELAATLRRACRPTDVLARLGGDEFAVLLAETTREDAEALAARLTVALDEAGVPASVGCSARGAEGLAGAWRDADASMYVAKDQRGRRPVGDPIPLGVAALPFGQHATTLVEALLAMLREHTGADICFVGRFENDVRIMRAVSSARPLPIGPGHVEALETTYCQRILDGRLPQVMPDTSLHPAAVALPITQALPIGGYLGVPIELPDGRVYGSLCCVAHAPHERFDENAAALLHSVAKSLARVLQAEERERAGRRAMLAELDHAVGGGMRVALQPIVDLSTGTCVGVEALARFPGSDRSVQDWFSGAAEVDRTGELELRALSLALAQQPTGALLWVNLSASVLVSPAVATLLATYPVERLVLEVSEHERIEDYEPVRTALAPWRARGMRLAVDDAGAGFASLRHVLELSPDVIKLDLSLVRGLEADPARLALVRALVGFAEQAGAQVVAEGVETAQERDAVRRAGVCWGQGFLLGRPVLVPPVALPSPRAATGISQPA